MRLGIFAVAALVAAGLAGRPAAAAPAVTGDYIEARSCNVMAGPCHLEGEEGTAGRQAVLAWKVRSGSYEGVDLSGVTAVALVSGEANLGRQGVQRTSVLYFDHSASFEQKTAMTNLLEKRAAAAVGRVVKLSGCSRIAFNQSGDLYTVEVPKVATIKVKKQPGQLCCIQKYEVGYQPFVVLKEAKVGYGLQTGFKDDLLKATWAGGDMNNAFFGAFTF